MKDKKLRRKVEYFTEALGKDLFRLSQRVNKLELEIARLRHILYVMIKK